MGCGATSRSQALRTYGLIVARSCALGAVINTAESGLSRGPRAFATNEIERTQRMKTNTGKRVVLMGIGPLLILLGFAGEARASYLEHCMPQPVSVIESRT
jgi:hypothetical protein